MITYVDYNLLQAISQFKDLIVNFPIIYYILSAAIVLGIIIYINLNNKKAFIITLILEIIAVSITFYYRGLDMFNHIDTIFDVHFYQNIFFYYWNSLVGLLIMHIIINGKTEKITKIISTLFYIIVFVNLTFSFYITHILNNNYMLVVGNIAPIVILGNILLFIIYVYLIIMKIVSICRKKK